MIWSTSSATFQGELRRKTLQDLLAALGLERELAVRLDLAAVRSAPRGGGDPASRCTGRTPGDSGGRTVAGRAPVRGRTDSRGRSSGCRSFGRSTRPCGVVRAASPRPRITRPSRKRGRRRGSPGPEAPRVARTSAGIATVAAVEGEPLQGFERPLARPVQPGQAPAETNWGGPPCSARPHTSAQLRSTKLIDNGARKIMGGPLHRPEAGGDANPSRRAHETGSRGRDHTSAAQRRQSIRGDLAAGASLPVRHTRTLLARSTGELAPMSLN